jgi:hypothetical protein
MVAGEFKFPADVMFLCIWTKTVDISSFYLSIFCIPEILLGMMHHNNMHSQNRKRNLAEFIKKCLEYSLLPIS